MSISPIMLADAPAIAGLSFRHVRGVKDADALYAVQVGRMAHDKMDLFCASEGFPTRDSLHAELAQAVAESRPDQWLVAQIDERVVGYSQIECWPEGDGTCRLDARHQRTLGVLRYYTGWKNDRRRRFTRGGALFGVGKWG